MAEDSLFWDGTSTGHAASTDIWSAPYSSAEMSDLLSTLLGNDAARGYTIPGFGNDLKIQANSPVALNVIAKSGRVMLRGRLYGNTADRTLSLGTADATNPRLDRIVARISFVAQTITLAVLAGTAAATPSLPSLTQNTVTYEISLAYVWVAAAATTIADTDIHDERVFAANFESLIGATLQTNYLTNSELMAFSSLESSYTSYQQSPEDWSAFGTVTTFANLTKPSQMSRGRAVKITAGAASSGMAQTVNVRANTTYAIKGLVQVTAGDVASIVVTTNSASPSTVTKYMRRTGAWIEYLIYYTTEADASTLTLRLLGLNNTDIVDFGQWLIVEGYVPGPFRQIHETIMFVSRVGDPDYDPGTFAANNTTTINLDTDYYGIILSGTKSILLRAEVESTASLSNMTLVSIASPGSAVLWWYIEAHGSPNNEASMAQGWTPVPTTRTFVVDVFRAAGTITLYLDIMGITI